jgi:hypothetical protein
VRLKLKAQSVLNLYSEAREHMFGAEMMKFRGISLWYPLLPLLSSVVE